MKYELGAYLSPETGAVAGCYENTTEFKRLGFDLENIEKHFIEYVPKFIIACMNGRVNGTMSLGIEDDGEVVGLQFPISDCHEIQKIYDVNFCGESPVLLHKAKDVASVITNCVLGPIFIPISNDPSRCVIEFDVRPATSLCGSMLFFTRMKGGKRNFWIRRGTVSQSFEDKPAKIEALEKEVKRRKGEREMVDMTEDIKRSSPSNPNLALEIQLRKLVLRRRARIVDDELSYCLILDNITSPHEDLSWIGSLRWNFVLDLHEDYGFVDQLPTTGDMMPKKMTFLELKKFQDEYQTRDKLREAIEFTEKTTWVQATRVGLNSIDWHGEARQPLHEAITTFTEEAAVSAKENLVFIILVDSDKNLDEIAELLKDIKSIVNNSEQFVLLFSTEKLQKSFKNEVKKFFHEASFIEQSLVIKNWKFLNNFMLSKQNSKYSMEGLRIPGNDTYGTGGVPVPSAMMKMLKSAKIDLLPFNQCEDLPKAMEETAYVRKGTNTIQDFFKGGQASWDHFHFSECNHKEILPGVVDRPHVTDIIDELIAIFSRTHQGMVQLTRLNHRKGGGATTIALNVLWERKHQYRCVWIDGNAIDWRSNRVMTAKYLHTILTHGEQSEGENKPTATDLRQVLVLLDNADDSMAIRLRDAMEKVLYDENVSTIRTLVNILFLVRTSGPEKPSKPKINLLNTEITHELYEEEKPKFKARLDDLTEKHGVNVASILEFVVMASNFKPKEDYIQGVVDDALQDIELYKNQPNLILYLSMLTTFGGQQTFALPEKHCQKIVCHDETVTPLPPFMGTISPQAKKFLIRDAKDPKNVMIRCPHEPVAKHLYKGLAKIMATSDVVIQMLNEKKIIKEKYKFSEVNQMMRRFLVSRQRKTENLEEETDREDYSPLLNQVQTEDEGYAKTVAVLQAGHDKLGDGEKSFIAQTLARFNIKHKKATLAIDWGERAVEEATQLKQPNKGACLDTLGHCHKWAMRVIRQELSHKGKYKLDNLTKALGHASEACKSFKKSRDSREYNMADDSRFFAPDFVDVSFGLCGLIEVSLYAVDLILLTEEFVRADESAARSKFIKLLRSPERDSIKDLAGDLDPASLKALDKLWKDNYADLFSKLLPMTKSCLIDAVRLMTDTQIRIAKVGEFSSIFEKLFSVDVVKAEFDRVRRSSRHSEMEKLAEYKVYFAGLVIKNFRSVADAGDQFLANYQNVAIAMDEIIVDNNLKWDEDDMIGWINIFFSLLYLDSERRELSYDTTKKFLWQLVKNTEVCRLKPEILSFFLIMHWPNSTNKISNECIRLLHMAVSWLYEYFMKCPGDPGNKIPAYFKLCLVISYSHVVT